MRITRFFASTRLFLLLFLVPPAAMWARSEGSGGFLLPTALALLALAHFAIFDAKTLDHGRRQRLAFTRHPDGASSRLTGLWGTWCTLLFALVTLVLLFAAPRVGLFFLVIGLIALPLTGGVGAAAGKAVRRRRMLWVELADPFAFLLLPAFWIYLSPVDREVLEGGEVVTESVARGLVYGGDSVTLLCALSLAVYLLTCLIRDADEDASEGQVTTPTLLGRHGATLLLMLTLVVFQIVGALSMTPGAGHFSWLVPAATAVGGMATLYLVISESDDAAPIVVLLTQAALIFALLV